MIKFLSPVLLVICLLAGCQSQEQPQQNQLIQQQNELIQQQNELILKQMKYQQKILERIEQLQYDYDYLESEVSYAFELLVNHEEPIE